MNVTRLTTASAFDALLSTSDLNLSLSYADNGKYVVIPLDSLEINGSLRIGKRTVGFDTTDAKLFLLADVMFKDKNPNRCRKVSGDGTGSLEHRRTIDPTAKFAKSVIHPKFEGHFATSIPEDKKDADPVVRSATLAGMLYHDYLLQLLEIIQVYLRRPYSQEMKRVDELYNDPALYNHVAENRANNWHK